MNITVEAEIRALGQDPPWCEGEGWRVVDSEGNVLQSGPPVVAQMVTNFGDPADQPDEGEW